MSSLRMLQYINLEHPCYFICQQDNYIFFSQDIEFYIINGAGHGFWGEAFDEAVEYIFAYLQELELV